MLIEPFYFGKAPNLLFGVYHPSVQDVRNEGVVICYPMGQEYMRSHRSFFRLASLLASEGFHVLRFDYYGTGDSRGDCDEISINQWGKDISTAIKELKEGCGLERVSLVGLRLGASLGLAVAQDHLINSVVLWNPVVSGTDYLYELENVHLEWLRGSFAKAWLKSKDKVRRQVLGFPLTERIVHELNTINLFDIKKCQIRRIMLMNSVSNQSYDTFLKHLDGIVADVSYQMFHDFEIWMKKQDELNKPLVPFPVLNAIKDWLVNV